MPFDLRLAVRALRRQPALALAVIVTLALAVAANTALFSVFDGLVFRPLPFPEADRLVHVEIPPSDRAAMTADGRAQLDVQVLTSGVLVDRAEARPAVMLEEGAADVGAWRLRTAQLSPNAFDLLGIVPAAGRRLTADDLGAGQPRPAMISEALWRTRFGGAADVIGQPIALPGLVFNRPLLLAGVMPRGVAFPEGANVWVINANSRPELFNLARLAPGVSIEQARAALPRVAITPLREHIRPDGSFAFGVLLSATGLLLLVAWVQVAALLLARTAGRTAEIGVRLALGASRGRLIRQLSAEGVVLASLAVALAWVLVPPLTTGIVGLLPEEMTRGQSLAPDLRALLFSGAISVTGVLAFTLLPMEVVRRASPLGLMRQRTPSASAHGAARLRTALLAAQLALTMVLLYMAGLTMHSLARVTDVDLGFTPERVVGVRLPLITVLGSTNAERRAHIVHQQQQSAETLDAIRRLPGIVAAAGGAIPFYDPMYSSGLPRPVTVVDAPGTLPAAGFTQITRDYLTVLGLRLVEGRVPAEDEIAAGPPAALVNETLAKEIARSGPVVGRPIEVLQRPLIVAGVVNDAVGRRPDRPVEPQVLQLTRAANAFVVAKLDAARPEQGMAALRTTLDRIWFDRASREIVDVAVLARQATDDYRARAVLLGLVGVLCLPLGAAGVAGAASDGLRQRVREIGIRMALGAEPWHIRRDIAGGALGALVVGLALGAVGGWAMGRVMSAYLFDVGAISPASFAAAAFVLLTVGAAGTVMPMRRALSIEPASALRDG